MVTIPPNGNGNGNSLERFKERINSICFFIMTVTARDRALVELIHLELPSDATPLEEGTIYGRSYLFKSSNFFVLRGSYLALIRSGDIL